jgi:hypothetical protein
MYTAYKPFFFALRAIHQVQMKLYLTIPSPVLQAYETLSAAGRYGRFQAAKSPANKRLTSHLT